jgi:hypothetical protein
VVRENVGAADNAGNAKQDHIGKLGSRLNQQHLSEAFDLFR